MFFCAWAVLLRS